MNRKSKQSHIEEFEGGVGDGLVGEDEQSDESARVVAEAEHAVLALLLLLYTNTIRCTRDGCKTKRIELEIVCESRETNWHAKMTSTREEQNDCKQAFVP